MIKKFFNWLDDRTGLLSFLKVVGERRWIKSLMALKVWPALMLFLVVVQAITGFILWMHYSPGSRSSYESVYYIQNVLWGGWLVRGLHHVSAQVFVAAAILYVLKQIFFGLYKAPREVVFWLSLIIFFFGLGACLTGDLLAWTQNGYGATMVRVKYLTQVPIVGQMLFELAVGGGTVTTLTITRFLALHIGVFAAGVIGLLIFHAVCDARAEKKVLDEDLASGKITIPAQNEKSCGGCRSTGIARWWSCQAAINSLVCLIAMVLILFFVYGHSFNNFGAYSETTLESGEVINPGQHLGAPLGPPADTDPTIPFGTARPEWSFRGLYQYALFFSGSISEFILIFCIPTVVLGVIFLMPFIARVRFGHIFNVAYISIFSIVMISLTMISYQNDADNADFQQTEREARETAARVFELVHARGGFTSEGALAMLKSDWKTQGKVLFKQHCATCHQFAPKDEKAVGPYFRLEEPTAPNIYAMQTKEWMAGWMDPETIRSSNYYGYKDSQLVKGEMVKFLRQDLPEIFDLEDPEEKADVERMIGLVTETLVAESVLAAPRERTPEGKPVGISEEALEAYDILSCSNCHEFYHFGGNTKTGPSLTGYASRDWLKKMIADPTPFFKTNDKMPIYYQEGSDQNRLTLEEIDMVTEWMIQTR
ncbi:MAG: cytochrome b N-terminal domain-containing protein [Planctomycetia bacterium]|nr:cytochrome b N-terminal domain-containing protein [Planctomycetia bacterium]